MIFYLPNHSFIIEKIEYYDTEFSWGQKHNFKLYFKDSDDLYLSFHIQSNFKNTIHPYRYTVSDIFHYSEKRLPFASNCPICQCRHSSVSVLTRCEPIQNHLSQFLNQFFKHPDIRFIWIFKKHHLLIEL